MRFFCCSKDTKLDEDPQGILLPLEVTGDTQSLLPTLCRIKWCFEHPGCCNRVACGHRCLGEEPVGRGLTCAGDLAASRQSRQARSLWSGSTDRCTWACAYMLCELGADCFLPKGINKWFFEANGLFCLYIYAIIPLQSCNVLPDVRLALYALTLMSYCILTPCPAHSLFPLTFPLLLWIVFLCLLACGGGCVPFCSLGVRQ